MRILLAGMSTMLTAIITAALKQSPDMIIAGVAGDDDDLDGSIRLARADAVVLQVDEPGASLRYRALLFSFPKLKIVAIASDGKGGFVHELRPSSSELAELSAASLLVALGARPLH
jgi:hypothetical protein